MNYPILPSYQPEQPSYLSTQAKAMTMDYMPEYSAPVSSISSTPEVPVQPIPVAPVSTVIPMSPEPNYLPPDNRDCNNRLVSFLNESMFYIDYHQELSSFTLDYRVYSTNLYGEMDDSGSPIMTFTRSLTSIKCYSCLCNGASYSITQSLSNHFTLKNNTTGQTVFTLKPSGECCSNVFSVIPEGPSMEPIKGKCSFNGHEGTILINDGAGVGTISVIGDSCCSNPTTAVVIISPKPNPQLDSFNLRLLYVFVMISLFE